MFAAARKFLVFPLICSLVIASDVDDHEGAPEPASVSGSPSSDSMESPAAARLVSAVSRSRAVVAAHREREKRTSSRRAQSGGVCGTLYWFFTGCGMCSRKSPEEVRATEDWVTVADPSRGEGGFSGINPLAILSAGSVPDEEEGGEAVADPLSGVDRQALKEYIHDELYRRGPHHRDEGPVSYCGKSVVSWIGSWGAAVVPHVMMMYAYYDTLPRFLGCEPLPIELEGDHPQSWAPLLINGSILGTHLMMMPGFKAQLHRLLYRTSSCCRTRGCSGGRDYQGDPRFKRTWSQCGRATAITVFQVGTGLANIVPDLRNWGGTVDTSNGLDAVGSASALPFFLAEFDEHMEDGAGLRSTVTYRDPESRRKRERLIAHAQRSFAVLKGQSPSGVDELFESYSEASSVLGLLRATVPAYYEGPATRVSVAKEALMGRRNIGDIFAKGYDDPGTPAVVAASLVNTWATYGLFTSAQFAFNTGAQALGVPAGVAQPLSYVGATVVSGTRYLKGMRDLPLYFEHIGNTLMCRRHRRDPSSDWVRLRMCGRAADLPYAFAMGMRDLTLVLPTLAQGDIGAPIAVGLPVVTVRAGTEYVRVLAPNRDAIVTDLRPAPRTDKATATCNTTTATEVRRAALMDNARQVESLALRAPDGVIDLMSRELGVPRVARKSFPHASSHATGSGGAASGSTAAPRGVLELVKVG